MAQAEDFQQVQQVSLRCPTCSQQHTLFSCQSFKDANLENRLALVKQKRLCFNCLKPGHCSTACSLNRVCTVQGCGRKHTKFLHPSTSRVVNAPQSTDEGQRSLTSSSGYVEADKASECSLIGAGSVRTALPIVPVMAKNPETHAELCTYALLDSGSTNSFCSYELVQQLGLKGVEVSLSLTTLEKADSPVKTSAVSVEVCELHGGEGLALPTVYVRESLPVSVQNKAIPGDVGQWPHLRGVDIPEVSASNVTLLIGQDSPEALIPLEVRRGEVGSNAPYATRTVFGWTLNGPLGRVLKGQQLVHANFIQSEA